MKSPVLVNITGDFLKKGNFIKEWKGAPEAEKELKINRVNINECCNNKVKSAGGFVWCFKDKITGFNFNKKI